MSAAGLAGTDWSAGKSTTERAKESLNWKPLSIGEIRATPPTCRSQDSHLVILDMLVLDIFCCGQAHHVHWCTCCAISFNSLLRLAAWNDCRVHCSQAVIMPQTRRIGGSKGTPGEHCWRLHCPALVQSVLWHSHLPQSFGPEPLQLCLMRSPEASLRRLPAHARTISRKRSDKCRGRIVATSCSAS